MSAEPGSYLLIMEQFTLIINSGARVIIPDSFAPGLADSYGIFSKNNVC